MQAYSAKLGPYLDKFKYIQAHRDIQAYYGVIRNNQALFRYTQEYSEPWHIQYTSIFRNLVYSNPRAYSEVWDIKNPGVFKTRGMFGTLSKIFRSDKSAK